MAKGQLPPQFMKGAKRPKAGKASVAPAKTAGPPMMGARGPVMGFGQDSKSPSYSFHKSTSPAGAKGKVAPPKKGRKSTD